MGPKTRTSDQIPTDQIPTTEPCSGVGSERATREGAVLRMVASRARAALTLTLAAAAAAQQHVCDPYAPAMAYAVG